ncbi:hypothetical protein [Pseudomonas bharatica]|uniref:hypothetical protein n=1 Tax=Pseudomonas bharatica TaxID=2692112 RepID=UPI003B2847EC
MFVVESLDILVSHEFLASLMIMPIGLIFSCYVGWLLWSKRKDRDLMAWLDSTWHVFMLRVFNVRLARIVLLMSVVPSWLIFIQLLLQLLLVGLFEYESLHAIPAQHYLPIDLLCWSAGTGLLLYLVLGPKGLLLPVGNGQSLSFDRKATIAIHINDKKPNIVEEGDKLIPLISKLRAMGVGQRIMVKSWLCVTRPPSADAYVIGVRRIFRRMSDISLWPAGYLSWVSRLLRPAKRGETGRINVLFNPLRWFLRLLLSLFYILLASPVAWYRIRQVPAPGLMASTLEGMAGIREALGEAVTPLDPTPVPLFLFISMSRGLPHIHPKFAGWHGGFIVGPAGAMQPRASAATDDPASV